jgi:hypothetical protein
VKKVKHEVKEEKPNKKRKVEDEDMDFEPVKVVIITYLCMSTTKILGDSLGNEYLYIIIKNSIYTLSKVKQLSLASPQLAVMQRRLRHDISKIT